MMNEHDGGRVACTEERGGYQMGDKFDDEARNIMRSGESVRKELKDSYWLATDIDVRIAAALRSAYAEGRRDMREEVAGLVEREDAKSGNIWNGHSLLAYAIRALEVDEKT